MGSQGDLPDDVSGSGDLEDREYTVLVTGFGPFRAEYPINPSSVICSRLPPGLPSTSFPASPRVRFIKHPSPIHVAYQTVREVVPALYAAHPDVDMVLHIGMAGGRRHYALETTARSGPYRAADVDGEHEGGVYEKLGTPAHFATGLDAEDVWRRWASAAPDLDLRPSDDAGLYMCEYIHYSSLLHYWKQGKPGPVAFLHVPGESTEEDIQRGLRAAITMTRAMVDSLRARGVSKKGMVSVE